MTVTISRKDNTFLKNCIALGDDARYSDKYVGAYIDESAGQICPITVGDDYGSIGTFNDYDTFPEDGDDVVLKLYDSYTDAVTAAISGMQGWHVGVIAFRFDQIKAVCEAHETIR